VALVADLRYDPEEDWLVHPVGHGALALRLAENAVSARYRPRATLAALAAASAAALGIAGTRGDADQAAERLLEQLSACDGEAHSTV
jgi:hypothetical protein